MRTAAIFALAVVVSTLTGCNGTEKDWAAAKQADTFSAYLDFHRKHPGSTRLTAVTADVECSQNLSISLGGYGLSGTASMSSLDVRVSGHAELSGDYRTDEAGARSLVERYVKLGGTIGKLPHAHLLVAQVSGRPRIVAVDMN
jgi:hypothetical protein